MFLIPIPLYGSVFQIKEAEKIHREAVEDTTYTTDDIELTIVAQMYVCLGSYGLH